MGNYINQHSWTIAEKVFDQNPQCRIVTILPPEASANQLGDTFFRGDIYDENGELGNDGKLDIIYGKSRGSAGTLSQTGLFNLEAAQTRETKENNRLFIPIQGNQNIGFFEGAGEEVQGKRNGHIALSWNIALRMRDEAMQDNPVAAHNLKAGDKAAVIRANKDGTVTNDGGIGLIKPAEQDGDEKMLNPIQAGALALQKGLPIHLKSLENPDIPNVNPIEASHHISYQIIDGFLEGTKTMLKDKGVESPAISVKLLTNGQPVEGFTLEKEGNGITMRGMPEEGKCQYVLDIEGTVIFGLELDIDQGILRRLEEEEIDKINLEATYAPQQLDKMPGKSDHMAYHSQCTASIYHSLVQHDHNNQANAKEGEEIESAIDNTEIDLLVNGQPVEGFQIDVREERDGDKIRKVIKIPDTVKLPESGICTYVVRDKDSQVIVSAVELNLDTGMVRNLRPNEKIALNIGLGNIPLMHTDCVLDMMNRVVKMDEENGTNLQEQIEIGLLADGDAVEGFEVQTDDDGTGHIKVDTIPNSGPYTYLARHKETGEVLFGTELSDDGETRELTAEEIKDLNTPEAE